jgi:hypothetical protein
MSSTHSRIGVKGLAGWEKLTAEISSRNSKDAVKAILPDACIIFEFICGQVFVLTFKQLKYRTLKNVLVRIIGKT